MIKIYFPSQFQLFLSNSSHDLKKWKLAGRHSSNAKTLFFTKKFETLKSFIFVRIFFGSSTYIRVSLQVNPSSKDNFKMLTNSNKNDSISLLITLKNNVSLERAPLTFKNFPYPDWICQTPKQFSAYLVLIKSFLYRFEDKTTKVTVVEGRPRKF